jgi:hypothetical protein
MAPGSGTVASGGSSRSPARSSCGECRSSTWQWRRREQLPGGAARLKMEERERECYWGVDGSALKAPGAATRAYVHAHLRWSCSGAVSQQMSRAQRGAAELNEEGS